MNTSRSDDPGELLRVWLQDRNERQGFNVSKLAKAVHLSPQAVGHWLRGFRGIRSKHWPAIASFFNYDQPDDILREARALRSQRRTRANRS